jgi:hypothetical protein
MAQLVVIVLVVIGLFLMFARSISVSASSEIRRPRTFVFGGLMIVMALAAWFVSSMFEPEVPNGDFSTAWLLSYAIPLVLIFLAVPVLKQPKAVNTAVVPGRSGADRVANIIVWVILVILVLGAGYIFLA